jgi:hypothetical protein
VARDVLLVLCVRNNGSFIAWLGTGLLVATAPFVARAQLEEAGVLPDPFDSGSSTELDTGTLPTPVVDSGLTDTGSVVGDAVPGPTLPNGEPIPPEDLVLDTSKGCTCTSIATSAGTMLAPAPILLAAALLYRRRSKK